MSDRIECFWIQPTDAVRRALRRFSFGDDCAARGYHDASAPIEDAVEPQSTARMGEGWPHDDPRWPSACECGYAFREADHWQLWKERVYERPDTLERTTIRDAAPGAMYDAEHGPPHAGPDGISLMVKLPGGPHDWWMVDGKSASGGGWTRTGAIPRVTATPSVQTPRYHGWLRDGALVPA